ncbi:hypothetical protein [Lentisalinibacter sediminis]|uniref:hypothetical protein n=1 Tax=Lentisalinibacter sediminis TaxID=2992237 RepID=UPI00386E2FCE
MSTSSPQTPADPALYAPAAEEFERTLEKLEQARPFGKALHQQRLLSIARKLLNTTEGIEALYGYAPRFDSAGLFMGGDWDEPEKLQPSLVRDTLMASGDFPALECLSELRFLAIATGRVAHPALGPADARAFLEDVLARNLDFPFPEATEFTRQDSLMTERLQRFYGFLLEHLGMDGILDALVGECERILLQRPIMVQRAEEMLHTAEHVLPEPAAEDESPSIRFTRWLIEALRGPSELARRHPDPTEYALALDGLDEGSLAAEAGAFGERMNRTGLVSRHHAVLLRHLAGSSDDLLADALALNPIGRTSLAEYRQLIALVIEHAVLPDTARCIYGLSRLLNRGILFFQPVAPGLQHLTVLTIDPEVAELLHSASQLADPPPANALLLAATLSVIGQPRGVDQGHNPTCQAARAISLWSLNDVGYLLEMIARAAGENEVVMHFEGGTIRSADLPAGLAGELHTELDAVSLVLTPHLDRIYMEMSRRTIGRPGDGHKWVNPEFHGWWVYRGFASLVDPATEAIQDAEGFVRRFHAAYHPEYNGGRDLVYAQPCGVVSVSASGEFVGWHAVSIQRVARDPAGAWRVYFFNPNRDKGQNWGHGIVTSTSNNGEWEGESSLPFEQFLMRLYVFHYKRSELGDEDSVPAQTVAAILDGIAESWAGERDWISRAHG